MPVTRSKPVQQSAPPVAIVFEKRPRWVPELQRQFLNEDVKVVACRSIADVEDRSAGVSTGLILLDLAAEVADCVQYLARHAADPNRLPVVVVGSSDEAPLEWAIRELGAAAFFARRIPGHEMADLCRRQWSEHL